MAGSAGRDKPCCSLIPAAPRLPRVVALGWASHAVFSSSWQIRGGAADLASPHADAAHHLQHGPAPRPLTHLLPVRGDPPRQLHFPPDQRPGSPPPVAAAAGAAAPPLPSGEGAGAAL